MVAAPLATQAFARPAKGESAHAESVLRAEVVQMPAWWVRHGVSEALQPGAVLPQGAEVQTGAGGAVALRMPEGSVMHLGERTRLDVQRLQASQKAGEWSMASLFRLVGGFVRYATTPLATASGRRDVQVQLSTATLGVRGTDFWAMSDEVHDAACLFEGRIALSTQRQGELVLDKPSDFWASFFDKPPAPVGVATPADLAKFMASVALKPGAGLAVAHGQWRIRAMVSAAYPKALALVVALRQGGFAAQVWERQAVERYSVEVRQLATEADAQALLARLRSLGVLGAADGEVGRVT